MAVTLESLRKSVGKKNSNSMVFAWLADLEREAGELDKALQRVDGGLTLYPNDISARLVRAKILIQLESYQPCVDECERIIVMDPFNLAAQQLMGDAYDKLGMEAERNACYRRLHDMDPLNKFWKDEYDVVLESTVAAAAAATADSEFVMSDSTPDMAQAAAEEAAPSDLSFGDDSEPKTEDAGTDSFEMPATADSIDAPAEESGSDASDEAMADDPFASLAAMLPNGDSADDSTMEDLSASLESAMDSIKTDESEGLVEDFGAEENISGSDVSSALSDMFGLDDDLEPEETTNSSPFSAAAAPASDVPASIDDNALSNAASVFDTPAVDDKPQSIDDAFGDIFGEDELPEEKPASEEKQEPAESESLSSIFADDSIESLAESPLAEGTSEEVPAEASSTDEVSADEAFTGGLFEKSAESSSLAKPAEDKPQSIDDAFGDIFGEDELPEEKPQAAAPQQPAEEAPAEEGGLFEKSAPADMNLTADEPALEEPTLKAPAADEPTTIDNAFDSIFGEDELPEEKPQTAAPQEESLELPADLELPAEELAPANDAPALESPIDNLFADDKPAEESTVVDNAPVLESPIDNLFADDKPAEAAPAEVEEPKVTQETAFSVDSAFDSIFGADDDLPEEKPAESVAAESAETVEPAQGESVSLEEQVNQAETELEMPEVKAESASDLAQEMGGAFASMFGNTDDDLDLPEASAPAETAEPESNDQELTGAPIEENFDKPAEEELSKDIDRSFDNLFGKDEEPVAESEKPVQEAPAAEPAQDLDSLESEVSGAFKGLFDMDDDSLPEETKPSNKGVDFLMSGDSDDEISAGLINDPDAPLDRGAQDLDESLNTRTLAEIYFDQGLYGKALEIYKDLAQKEPENEDIAARLSEVEKLYNEKFGGNA